jgi:hypothetical protein
LVRYNRKATVAIEDVICEIHRTVFPSWQIQSCPEDWIDRYVTYMRSHGIAYREELWNGTLWFLVPGKHRPHRWKLPGE